MAVYKVPQDVEAEDKLLGPLTLKQFIFLIITILLCYMAFLFGRANLTLVIPFLPGIGLFGYLAAPFTRDQPTDVYLGARLRFLFKPRRRIWDQAGAEELVRITVPKKVEVQLTNNLNPYEVRSRLNILASTIDSRGWATKNAYVNEPGNTMVQQPEESDRLVTPMSQPSAVPDLDITAADDMLDPSSNRVAYHMDQLATQATTGVRDEALAQMKAAQDNQARQSQQVAAPSMPAMTQQAGPAAVQPQAAPVVAPTPAPQPAPRPQSYPTNGTHYDPYPPQMQQHILQPLGSQPASQQAQPAAAAPAPKNQTTDELPQSAKLGLAQRDDLSVDTIAREAGRVVHGDSDENEVIIHLH